MGDSCHQGESGVKMGQKQGKPLVVVGDKFKRPRICWAAISAALVSCPSREDSVAADNWPPSRPNPLQRVAEALHYIGMLSECLHKFFSAKLATSAGEVQ